MKITRWSLGATLILFVLLVALFWGRHLWNIEFGEEWIHAGVSLAAVFMAAYSASRIVLRNLVFAVRTHVFLPLMVIIGFGIIFADEGGGAAVSMFLVTRGGEYFASAFRRTARPGDLFGGGLMMGLAPLACTEAAVFLALIPIAMIVYMRNFRETLLAFTGAALPIFARWYVGWATGEGWTPHFPMLELPELGLRQMILGGLLAAGVVVSLGSFVFDRRRIRTRAYRIHIYLFFWLIVSFAGFRNGGDFALIAVPAGVIAASWFSRHEGVVAQVFYISMLIMAVVANA